MVHGRPIIAEGNGRITAEDNVCECICSIALASHHGVERSIDRKKDYERGLRVLSHRG